MSETSLFYLPSTKWNFYHLTIISTNNRFWLSVWRPISKDAFHGRGWGKGASIPDRLLRHLETEIQTADRSYSAHLSSLIWIRTSEMRWQSQSENDLSTWTFLNDYETTFFTTDLLKAQQQLHFIYHLSCAFFYSSLSLLIAVNPPD